MQALLTRLLRDEPSPLEALDVGAWWTRIVAEETAPWAPVERAVLCGFRSDRVAGAFAGGYQAALRALAPALPDGIVVSLCVTEEGGNAPRAIASRLTRRPDGGFTLSGAKRWSTLAPLARVLLVAASEGTDAAGRSRIRLVRVAADAAGVEIAAMPPTPFSPEVPHAEIALRGVEVEEEAVLPGDGYAEYVRRFRTVEDIHVNAAVGGYLVSVARRHAFPPALIELVIAGVVTAHALAHLHPDDPATHVAVAGWLAENARVMEALDAAWAGVEAEERARWRRDRAMFGSVAGAIREARRRRAWERLAAADGPVSTALPKA